MTDNEKRLRSALERAQKFITYARYELDDTHCKMEQFPCKECADDVLKDIQAALAPAAESEGAND
jgi:hypothetical protein